VASEPASSDAPSRGIDPPRLTTWLRRLFAGGLLAAGIALWVHHLRTVDWAGMRGVIRGMPPERLGWALAFTAASYLVYSSIDLVARHVTRHRVSAGRVLAIGFISHACALNLGPAGAGFRFRLYMAHGLDAPKAAAIWLFNVATNWLGFVLVAGLAFATRSMRIPAGWGAAAGMSQAVGVLLLALLAAYLVACQLAHGREWTVFGRTLTPPSPAVAALQCMVSAINWLLLAWVLTMLLQHGVPFGAVLGALMASSLALAVIDVPAGLGVLETVFLAMLGSQMSTHELLAAMLAYRAIYFVAPLLIALAAYAAIESRFFANRRARPSRFHRPGSAGPALHPRRSPSGSTRSRP
jgi:glycosyltransferase 2 family protein